MEVANQTLQATLNSANQYVIPVFQRYYSWRKPSWEKLWNDLVELQESDQLSARHFMGSLVFVPRDPATFKVPSYQVVDGQQRLITLSLLLCALRDVAYVHNFDDLAEEITQCYLVHPFKKGVEYFRVFPRQRDRDQYMAAIQQRSIADGAIKDALDYFMDQIAATPDTNTEHGLRSFFELVQKRLEFVHITLGGENPYQIFRSLNSTGVDLSEGDLIRNFVFMHVPIDQQDEFDDQEWKPLEQFFVNEQGIVDGKSLSAFFRDYLMREGRYIGPTATFDRFEKRYSGQSFDAIMLARNLRQNAAYYHIVRGRRAFGDKAVDEALGQLRELDSSTTYPLLLVLIDRCSHEQMTATELARAIELLAGFILRRFVCQESSRGYGRWFVSACPELGDNPLSSLRSFLAVKGYPDDARFKSELVRFNRLYQSDYCKLILQSLERAYRNKEQADLSLTQVEHIMPQTLTDAWKEDLGSEWNRIHQEHLHTLGNLTLTAYNLELSNKPFSEKRLEYERSNIFITRNLAQCSTWTEANIVHRGEKLAEQAIHIWLGPDA